MTSDEEAAKSLIALQCKPTQENKLFPNKFFKSTLLYIIAICLWASYLTSISSSENTVNNGMYIIWLDKNYIVIIQ